MQNPQNYSRLITFLASAVLPSSWCQILCFCSSERCCTSLTFTGGVPGKAFATWGDLNQVDALARPRRNAALRKKQSLPESVRWNPLMYGYVTSSKSNFFFLFHRFTFCCLKETLTAKLLIGCFIMFFPHPVRGFSKGTRCPQTNMI